MIRAGFLGTPVWAVPSLEALARRADIRLVVTPPDRRRGRGRVVAAPPVKVKALDLGLPIHQPATRRELDAVVAAADLDVVVVVAYRMIVPPETLDRPRRGMLNLHFSLLPRWRGAAPVQRAMLAGDTTTGVTLMQMDAGLDTGAVLDSWVTSIGSDETAGELSRRLAAGAAELVEARLEAALAGRLAPRPQDGRLATAAPRFATAEAELDFEKPASEVVRAIRAFSPRPGAYTTWRGRRFKIHRGREVSGEQAPGTLVADRSGVRVGTGRGCVDLQVVQPAGARSIEVARWLRGVRGEPGRFA